MGNKRSSLIAGIIVGVIVSALCVAQMLGGGKDPGFSVIVGVVVGGLSGIMVAAAID